MKKTRFLIAATMVAVTAFVIVSCSKQSVKEAIATEPVTKEKVQSLAQRFNQPLGNDYIQPLNDYKNLNETDLKSFWHEIYLGNKKAGKTTITEEEFSALFEKVNSDSKKAFGEPFNKIPTTNLTEAMKFRDNTSGKVIPIDPPPGGGCGFYTYPVNLYENQNLIPSPPFFTYSIVDYWPGDCDGVEAVYSGFWNASKSITLLGYQTGPVCPIGKYENGNTKVLFKKSVMLMAFGSIPAINNHKRMANQTIVESRN